MQEIRSFARNHGEGAAASGRPVLSAALLSVALGRAGKLRSNAAVSKDCCIKGPLCQRIVGGMLVAAPGLT